jgi:hypothetical protein
MRSHCVRIPPRSRRRLGLALLFLSSRNLFVAPCVAPAFARANEELGENSPHRLPFFVSPSANKPIKRRLFNRERRFADVVQVNEQAIRAMLNHRQVPGVARVVAKVMGVVVHKT